MSEVLKIIHKLDDSYKVIGRSDNADEIGPNDRFADLLLEIDAPHEDPGMFVLIGDRHEGHSIVLNQDEAYRVSQQLIKYASSGKRRWDLANIEDVRNRRDELLLAVEQTVAQIKIEEMEEDPNLDWLKRATSFVYQGKAILYRLEQLDRDERRKAYNQAMGDSAKKIARFKSMQGQVAAAEKKMREMQKERRQEKEENTRVRHELHNANMQLVPCKLRLAASRKAVERKQAELNALRAHLGAEEFQRIVDAVRIELEKQA